MLQIAVKSPVPERTIALIQGAPMNAPMQGPMFGPSLAGPAITLLGDEGPSFSKTILTAFAIGFGSILIFGLAGAGAFDSKPRK